eukprot:scaffold19798_cov146-Isochrysis_galbana.AAC.5
MQEPEAGGTVLLRLARCSLVAALYCRNRSGSALPTGECVTVTIDAHLTPSSPSSTGRVRMGDELVWQNC